MPGEVTEIAIVRNERYVMIDAGLGDEGIRQLGLETLPSQRVSKESGSFPVPIDDGENCCREKILMQKGRRQWIAQELRDDDGRQRQGAIGQSGAHDFSVMPAIAAQITLN